MAGLQTIIDNCTFITINARPVTGQSISRSGHYKTASRSPSPYSITTGMHDGLTYSENRDTLQALDNLDRTTEANISITNNSGMNYLTANLNGQTNNACTVLGYNGADLYVDASSATGSGTLFKAGDWLQPLGNTSTYRYPYQVTTDTTGSFTASNVTVKLNRPVLAQTGVALNTGGLRLGNDIRFHVKMFAFPEYSVIPHDRISFSGDFELIEVIT
jgi:hypothetical protein